MAVKNGIPDVGYERPITRVESELTGMTRSVFIENNANDGVVFWKSDTVVTKGAKTAARKLHKFWSTK
jgi:hypothetical protein